jgi:putative transposase
MVRKRYTPAQKAAIVLELVKEEETLPQIPARHGVHPNLLRKWKAQALEGLPGLFTDDGGPQQPGRELHRRVERADGRGTDGGLADSAHLHHLGLLLHARLAC